MQEKLTEIFLIYLYEVLLAPVPLKGIYKHNHILVEKTSLDEKNQQIVQKRSFSEKCCILSNPKGRLLLPESLPADMARLVYAAFTFSRKFVSSH